MRVKRLLIALFAACLTAVAAYAIFIRSCPETRKFDCEIKWLGHKLALTPEQEARVRAIHLKHCPTMNGLRSKEKSCADPARKDELRKAECESTTRLIEAVCAELNPQQRQEYMALIEAKGKCKLSEQKPADVGK